MNKRRIIKAAIGLGRDLLFAFIIVLALMLVLYAYCGIWPPMVVVESGSMQHSNEESYIGVIDTGDMVFVKNINSVDDLTTYVDGEAMDYSTYGAFGDVVIYRPNGNIAQTPIIHRIVVWIEANDSLASPAVSGVIDYENYTFDIPSLGISGSVENITLQNYGHNDRAVIISLWDVLITFSYQGVEPHDGFITLGDNNPTTDQRRGSYFPVKGEWVVGKAIGELPWFGLIKLTLAGPHPNAPQNSWISLFICIVLLVSIPFLLDFGPPLIRKWSKKRKGGGLDEKVADETGPVDVNDVTDKQDDNIVEDSDERERPNNEK
jgi:signal peptidase